MHIQECVTGDFCCRRVLLLPAHLGCRPWPSPHSGACCLHREQPGSCLCRGYDPGDSTVWQQQQLHCVTATHGYDLRTVQVHAVKDSGCKAHPLAIPEVHTVKSHFGCRTQVIRLMDCMKVP